MNTTDTHDPDAIEADIKRTQDEMGETVNRIGDRFTPRNLFNELLDKADENGIDARYLLDGARRNPLALGLISAGTIWLISDADAKPSAFTSNKSKTNFDDDQAWGDTYDPDHRGYVDHMSRFERRQDEDELSYQRRRDEHRGSYLLIERNHDEDDHAYRQRLNDATDRIREKRDQFASAARQRGHDIAEGGRHAAEKGKQAARRGKEAFFDNPMIGGLIAAAVGAVAGAAVPSTRTEREYLGDTGRKAIDRAEDKAMDAERQAMQKKDEMVERADRRMEEAGPA
ncbi:DUF3618 domain-containing protein [Sphingomicrobium sp. XHP0239]|uniref:DUF3618 domain-containing protein n=1 Tax=Sphingomicrobium maritimum TaxID=3133972 RepID=UPI0031CC9ADD